MPPMARGTSVMRRAFCQVFTEPPLLCRPGLGKLGAVTAIEEVDEQADDQPDEEAIPGDDGQAGHEQEAKDDAERGNDGPAGNDETTAAVGIAEAEDDDSDGDEDKGEKRADVGEVGEGADVEEAGGNGDDKTGNPGGEGRGAKEGMDVGEDFWQQAIAGHG